MSVGIIFQARLGIISIHFGKFIFFSSKGVSWWGILRATVCVEWI